VVIAELIQLIGNVVRSLYDCRASCKLTSYTVNTDGKFAFALADVTITNEH